MSGDIDIHSDFTVADLSSWRSKIEKFIDETRGELAGLIASIQSDAVIDSPDSPTRKPTFELDAHRLPTPPPRITPVAPTAAPESTPPDDFDDRLAQLKRRIAEQLRGADDASLNVSP